MIMPIALHAIGKALMTKMKQLYISLVMLMEQISNRDDKKLLGLSTREADEHYEQEEVELIHALTVYLDVLKQGK